MTRSTLKIDKHLQLKMHTYLSKKIMKIFLTFFFSCLWQTFVYPFFFHRFQVVFQIYSPTRVVWLGRRSSIKGIPESSSNTDPASFGLGIPMSAPAVNCIFLTTEYLLTKSIKVPVTLIFFYFWRKVKSSMDTNSKKIIELFTSFHGFWSQKDKSLSFDRADRGLVPMT